MDELFRIGALTGAGLAVAYAVEILRSLYHWKQLPESVVHSGFQPTTSFSVIIPARNEAANIGACLDAVLLQYYPSSLLEIIVVDDFSSDDTAAIVRQYASRGVRLLQPDNASQPASFVAYKKKALETGIAAAMGEWIVTTDADCIAPPDWLRTIAAGMAQHDAVLVAGPVGFHQEKNLLEQFQSLDYLGMMLLTGAAVRSKQPHLANGANLAYAKVAFQAVGGFSGIDHLASGDDMLLLQKIAAHDPSRIAFAKSPDALVLTRAKHTFPEFWKQRLRWASKSSAFRNPRLFWTLGVVFLLCWAILSAFVLTPFAGAKMLVSAILLLLAKSAADYLLLSTACRYFRRSDLLRYFWPAQLLHIAYIALIGLASLFYKRYEWKGRSVR